MKKLLDGQIFVLKKEVLIEAIFKLMKKNQTDKNLAFITVSVILYPLYSFSIIICIF